MLNVVWDMETNDPDDFITLLFLLGHPRVHLKAVTITPGTPYQVGLVKKALSWFEKDIPIGAYNISHLKKAVSDWHYNAYKHAQPSEDAAPGWQVLQKYCDENTTLITGAPLKNLGVAINEGNFKLGRLVAQGGFAGEGVVPEELQLPQFKNHSSFPTFNFNGDPKAVFTTLSCKNIGIRYFVSKNVCHKVFYDQQMHAIFSKIRHKSKSLELIWQGMDYYLKKRSQGKKFHDPLAACCAIEPQIATWAEVEIFREKGGWGSRLCPGSNNWIIVDYNHELFVSVLTEF